MRFWVIILLFMPAVGFLPAAVDPAWADLNGSLTIDWVDVLLFADSWLAHDGPSDDWNAACDISSPPDGVIDAADVVVFADDWLTTFPNPADFVNRADFNTDLKIDFHDLSILAAAWGSDDTTANWNLACDIAEPADGVIDVNDLLVFSDSWLYRVPTLAHWHYGSDVTGDLRIDLADYSAFSAAWLSNDSPTPNWNIACDVAMPRDGRVDATDLAVLSEEWLAAVPDPNDLSDAADMNNDYRVDLEDWAVLSLAWLADDEPMGNWNVRYDVAEPNDGRINTLDYVVLANVFGFTIPDPNLFSFIPGGQFEMGDHSNTLPAASRPVHDVIVDAFYMSRFQMTNRRYCDFLNSAMTAGEIKIDNEVIYAVDDGDNSHPYCDTHSSDYWSRIEYAEGLFSVRVIDGTLDMAEHPMVRVNWFGAAAYCNWKSRQENRQPCYDTDAWTCDFTADGYRLPTEAEWECAARGGLEGRAFPWGDTLDGSMANFVDSGDPFDATTPVGYYNGDQTPAGSDMVNGYGLYDMAGNVYEWCCDWYSGSYYNECRNQGVVNNPTGPADGTKRVLRGGSWNADTKPCRTAFRDSNHAPGDFSGSYGFRICLPAP